MDFVLNEAVNRRKATLKMALASVIAAALCVLFGEFALPLLVAFYATLIILDSTRAKIATVSVAVLSAVLTVLLYVFDFGTPALVFGCIGGVITALLFCHGVSKGEIAFYLVIAFTVMLVGSIYLYFAGLANSFSPAAVVEIAEEWYVALRGEFASAVIEAMSEYPNELFESVDEAYIGQLFDAAFNMSYALVAILAFILAGVSLKIFSSIAYKISKEPQKIVFWRFATSNVVAYFYCALLVLNFFSLGNEVLSIAVTNLFYVFMAVYAYVGYNFAVSIISGRFSYLISSVIVIAAILFFGIFAIEILSLFGVVFTHISNKVGWHTDNNKS